MNKLQKIRSIRHGHTLAQAAKAIGTTPATVGNIEHRRHTPRFKTAQSAAEYYGMTVEDLYTWIESGKI